MMSEGTAGLTKKVHKPCPIQQFFGDAGFSTSVVRRRTVVQPGSLGGSCKPSPAGSRGNAPENFDSFAF